MAKKPELGRTVVAQNRKARHNYFIEETMEAGLSLTGTEVKSLRGGRSSIAEAYITEEGGEAWMVNSDIPEYASGNRFNHERKRPRKLLMKKREILKFAEAAKQKGLTLIPLSVQFDRGFVKVTMAVGKGRQLHDKREKLKEKSAGREMREAVRKRK